MPESTARPHPMGIPPPRNPIPEQVLFASPSPLANAFGLSLLGFGFHDTKKKRFFNAMKPWSLPFWSINWVSRGGGWFENSGARRLRIRAGEAIVRFPHEPCRYGHAPGGAWDEYWLLFDGALPARLAEEGLLDRNRPVLRPRRGDFLGRFEAALVEARTKRPRVEHFARLLVDLFFASLPPAGRSHRPVEQEADAPRRFYEHLHARVGEPMKRLPELAAPFGNYHSLRRAFQRRYGKAPQQVLLEAKLLTARRLLLSTRDPLAVIAGKIGVDDVSYFIRMFRKRFGVTPAKLRLESERGA